MYQYYGIYHKSCLEVCQTLEQLGYAYHAFGKTYYEYKQHKAGINTLPIYIVESLERAERLKKQLDSGMMVICDSQPALKKTNANRMLYPGLVLREALKRAIDECLVYQEKNKRSRLSVSDLTLKEVLKVATTYSFLNGIQTALYKITPYALRKESQQKIIAYFYGELPYRELITHLESSAKLDKLLLLCKDKQAKALRQACILSRKDMSKVEDVAKETGFASFEIVYIVKSYEKTLEGDA